MPVVTCDTGTLNDAVLRSGCSVDAVSEENGKMAVSEKKTGRRQYSPEQRLLAIAPMLSHNRQHESAAQAFRGRDRPGRFSAVGVAVGQRPSLVCIAQQIAAEYKVGETTVWRWYCRYRRGGYRALVRKRRVDIGRSSFLWRHPHWKRVIAARLSAGQNPFALAQDLSHLFGSGAPKYGIILKYANHRYSVDGEPASRESAAL